MGRAKALMATAAALRQQQPLLRHRGTRGRIVQGAQQRRGACIAGAALDGQRGLRRRRRNRRQRQYHARQSGQQLGQQRPSLVKILPEPRESREGENHAIELTRRAARLTQPPQP